MIRLFKETKKFIKSPEILKKDLLEILDNISNGKYNSSKYKKFSQELQSDLYEISILYDEFYSEQDDDIKLDLEDDIENMWDIILKKYSF